MQNDVPPTKKRRFHCASCGKEFTRFDNLKRHQPLYQGDKPRECPHCDKAFTRKSDLTRHIKQVHEQRGAEREYTCNTCGASFRNLAPLGAHQQTAHQPPNATGKKRQQQLKSKLVSLCEQATNFPKSK